MARGRSGSRGPRRELGLLSAFCLSFSHFYPSLVVAIRNICSRFVVLKRHVTWS